MNTGFVVLMLNSTAFAVANTNYTATYETWLRNSWIGTQTVTKTAIDWVDMQVWEPFRTHNYTKSWQHAEYYVMTNLDMIAKLSFLVTAIFVVFAMFAWTGTRKANRRSVKVVQSPKKHSCSPIARIKMLRTENTNLFIQITELTDENASLKTDVKQIRDQLGEQSLKFYKVTKEKQELEKEVQTLRAKINDGVEKTAKQLRTELVVQKATVDTLRESVTSLFENNQLLGTEIQMLRAQLAMTRKNKPDDTKKRRVARRKTVPTKKTNQAVRKQPKRACAPTSFFDWPNEHNDKSKTDEMDEDWRPGDD